MLQDITPLKEADNLGGLNNIEFALVDDIASIPDANGMLIATGIVMKAGAGKRFYCAPLTLESKGFTETGNDSSNGTSYSKQVAGFCPADVSENAGLFEQMENARFVLIVKDSNDRKRVVGTIEEPLQFKIDRNTQTNIDGNAGVNITWFGDGKGQSPFYDV